MQREIISNEQWAATGGLCREHIVLRIADKKSFLAQEVMFSLCAKEKAGPWFSAITTILDYVRAVVHLGDVSAGDGGLQLEAARNALEFKRREQSFSNACLVGNDQRRKIVFCEKTQCVQGSREKFELLPGSDVTARNTPVNNAVAVQEDKSLLGLQADWNAIS